MLRGRTVLILLVLVVGLVAFIELYEHQLPSTEERTAREKLVLDIEPDEIIAVNLAWGGQRVHLERQLSEAGSMAREEDLSMSSWRLVEPISARADASLIVALIESLATLEKNRILQGSAPEDMGLIPPRLVVTLTAGAGATELRVGSEVPAGNSMIVATANGDEIVVVDNSLWPELTRQAGDWRTRQVLDVGQENIERVVLEQGDRRVTLANRGGDFWLETPVEDRADAEGVGNLLAALASMRIVSFADEWPESISGLGLDPPAGRLEITVGKEGEVERVWWGGEVPNAQSQHFARTADQSFSTEVDLQQYFDRTVAQWRSRRLTSLETFEIDVLEVVESGQDTMILGRDGANWNRGEDEISFPTVSDLLYAITGARAAAVLPESQEAQAEIVASEPVLKIGLQGGGREQIVSFYSLSEEGAHVTVSEREVVLFVGKDEFTEILTKVRHVRAANSVKDDVDEQLPSGVPELSFDQ